jgi:hypothetical protein
MPAPVVTFPDIVTSLLPYLRAQIASVTFAASVPNPRPTGALVTLRRSGGVESSPVTDRPRVDAQVWHTSEFNAFALAAQVRAHLIAAPGRVAGIYKATTFLGPTPVPDPDSSQPRVLFTVEFILRGA